MSPQAPTLSLLAAVIVAGSIPMGACSCSGGRPNILFMLTDDEDTVLGGDSPLAMPRGLPLLTRSGAHLENWFAHTPVCACSRAEIMTGRFFHNLADRPVPGDDWDAHGNSYGPCYPQREGGACGPPSSAPGRNMHLNFSKLSPGPTVFEHLAAGGYKVGIMGKYLNRVPVLPSGYPQIPAGVLPEDWFVSPGDEANKSSPLDHSGEYYPSFYYHGQSTWTNTNLEYETSFLGNRSVSWIRNATSLGQPWFLYLAPHSPHGLALVAPWYLNLQINQSVPKPESWNYSAEDHHWLVAQQPPLTHVEAQDYNLKFQKRWKSLRAVDDIVASLVAEIENLSIGSNTYIFFTADHGYHFGELRLPEGKWNVYDTDIRVPMRISGPGINPGSKMGFVASHVDLAPTWLEIADIDVPLSMDGRSVLSALTQSQRSGEEAIIESEGLMPAGGAYIEYHGLGLVGSPGRLGDSWNNTYRAIRVIDNREGGLGNVLYAEFGSFEFDTISFHEFYNLDSDPFQMHNLWSSLNSSDKTSWATRVANLFGCAGRNCTRGIN